MTSKRNAIFTLAAVDFALILTSWVLLFLRDGLKVPALVSLNNSVVLGPSLSLIGVTTFFGLLLCGVGDSSQLMAWLRHAIAAAFVVVYIVLIAYLFTSPQLRQSLTDPKQVGFGKDIFTGFTTFLGVILAFYFTAQAAEVVAQTIQAGATSRTEAQQATIREAMRRDPNAATEVPARRQEGAAPPE